MPEGHILHRIAREHRSSFVGAGVTVSSPQGRFDAADRLSGLTLNSVEAYGKHLLYEFDGSRYVHVHLGLFGRVHTDRQPTPPAGPNVRMRLEAQGWYADLTGPTRCALIDPSQRAELLARLGPDPLRRGADPQVAYARIVRSRQPIAALLMDQRVIAGIGNVYRAELLFLAGLDPFLPGSDLEPTVWHELWADTCRRLRAGLRRGRIVTTDPADRAHRARSVHPSDANYVYRRSGQPCRRCGTVVTSTDLAGRVLYWCPSCQA